MRADAPFGRALGPTGDSGVFARGSAALPGATADYPASRWEAPDRFTVHFAAAGSVRPLLLFPALAADFVIERVQPEPDQHFGGALTAIAGGMPYLLAATVAAWRCIAGAARPAPE